MVAAGATSFELASDGRVPPLASLRERVWADSGGAGGGGQSLVFGMPRYQVGAGLAGLSSGRALPDLALAASPVAPGYVIVEGGLGRIVGGTSAGTPALASALALVNQRPARRQTGGDGDPQCDADGAADGQCMLRVALGLDVFDTRNPQLHARGPQRGLPLCRPGTVRRARLLSPRTSRRDPTAAANHRALAAALGALPLPTRLDAACTATVPVVVPVNGRVALRALVADTRGPVTPRVTLRCTP